MNIEFTACLVGARGCDLTAPRPRWSVEMISDFGGESFTLPVSKHAVKELLDRSVRDPHTKIKITIEVEE